MNLKESAEKALFHLRRQENALAREVLEGALFEPRDSFDAYVEELRASHGFVKGQKHEPNPSQEPT